MQACHDKFRFQVAAPSYDYADITNIIDCLPTDNDVCLQVRATKNCSASRHDCRSGIATWLVKEPLMRYSHMDRQRVI